MLAVFLYALVTVIMSATMAVPVFSGVDPDCRGFSVVSPVENYLQWTEGECHHVAWDVGASKVETIATVDIFRTSSRTRVITVAKNLNASIGTTNNFTLHTNNDDSSGYYYFVLMGITHTNKTCRLTSTVVQIHSNPNATESTCE